MFVIWHKGCCSWAEIATARYGVFVGSTNRFPAIKALKALIFLIFLTLSPGTAAASVAEICDRAARRVAAESSVPLSVLWSITRTETGRPNGGKLQPWPWTVNMEGKGHWFNTETEARAYVFKHFKRGARSFDVGCFQINYKWHGAAFRSIDQMFDPLENARYAADFLTRLYQETGDWSAAAGAYHSRTPKYANRYRARFDRIRSGHIGEDGPTELMATRSTKSGVATTRTAAKERQNTYPLLQQSGGTRSFGSLVRLSQGQSRSLFDRSAILEGS